MKLVHFLTLMFVLIGGIHLGLIGLLKVDLIGTMFGASGLATLVYVLVTLSTLHVVLPMLTKHLHTS